RRRPEPADNSLPIRPDLTASSIPPRDIPERLTRCPTAQVRCPCGIGGEGVCRNGSLPAVASNRTRARKREAAEPVGAIVSRCLIIERRFCTKFVGRDQSRTGA